MVSESKQQGDKQLHSKNYLLKMPRFHAKLKNPPQKLNFLMAKAISKPL